MGVKNFNGTVDADYLKETAEMMRALKEKSYVMMGLKQGDRALDIGCGPGTDVFALAGITGPGGKVVGIDTDEKMLKEAQKENNLEGVEFLKGDVAALPFPDGYFDAVRAERLFQVLPASYDMNIVLGEMIRVLKKGGSLVLCDTDWGSASVDYPDPELTDRLLHFFARILRPNGYAGRQFPGLVKRNGLTLKELEVVPMVMNDFSYTVFESWLIKEAVEHKVALKEEMEKWENHLSGESAGGCFFASVNMVFVSALKP